ncbi:MAG: hypothetical protein K9N47_03240 [Prosthecobacter sp.]|uniref:O-antigen ligase family protein n=1 Tax=Prosthecobacter sp. TaxID=1965333 RepID=UPI0025CCA79F|nr:O-antigen ligase family protein [Prosthecobacter sp.]MCF7785107.1 hypothetical protein [Prosthecobacter sp.]
MDFICACLLVFCWYVRPQDIFSIISGVSVVKYLMYVGIIATLRRPGGFSRALLWAGPMDWLVTAYCVWAIYVTPEHTATAKEVFTYFTFHVVTALALTSWRRIEIYLNCWFGCLGILALMAVSTHWGFELVKGSAELTVAFHDRLTLNTWVFRNPNALAHGVMALIPGGIAWFLMAGSKHRLLGMVLVGLAIHCVLLTQSKGAFLAGAGALTMVYLFKRPAWFQVVVLVVVYAVGLAALKSLPRMDTLSKSDEGIQGRMIVWQQAKASMEASTYGVGLKLFQGFVPVRLARLHRTFYMPIATHGSYVRHGADLGYVGLMLFAGIFYGGARLLLTAQTEPHSEALRAQRAIYALLITTAISCWVVDRAYHMDFFLLSGLLSAFHRRFRSPSKTAAQLEIETLEEPEADTPLRLPAYSAAPAAESAAAREKPQTPSGKAASEEEAAAEAANKEPDRHGAIWIQWNRLGVVDVVMMYVLLKVLLYYWELFSTDFVVF